MPTKQSVVYGLLAVILAIAFTACGGGGGKSLNSASALKEYLDKQPANSPDKPIKVSMSVNDMMIENVMEVIGNAGKYVSLDLSKSTGLTVLEDDFFEYVEALVSITIPKSVESIYALSGPNLISIKVDSGNPNYTVEGGILYNKAKTEIVSVPKGISGNVIIPNSVTDIGEAFRGCTGITGITIPNGVTYIDDYTFSGCTNLASVTIPDSITSIDDGAFRNTGLTGVTIPVNVAYIGERAFSGCEKLTSVTFQGTIESRRFSSSNSFPGDLRAKYIAGGVGTYTRPNGESQTWTKQ